MAVMTDEEADALDELLTRTSPKVRAGEGGLLTRQRGLLSALDPVAANYLRSQAEIKRLSPSEIIGEWVREKIAGEAESPALVS